MAIRWPASVAELRRHGLVRIISLGGLDQTTTSSLIETWAGNPAPAAFVRAMHAETDGNPFFVQEVLVHLAETGVLAPDGTGWRLPAAATEKLGLPETIREVVTKRLGRLPEPVQRILVVSAVVGREFDLDVVAHVAEIKQDELLDAIEVAVAARLVDEVSDSVGRFRFVHELIRSTLAETLSAARQARVHLRVGSALEQQQPDDLATLANHYAAAAAAGAVKAVEYAELAAATPSSGSRTRKPPSMPSGA